MFVDKLVGSVARKTRFTRCTRKGVHMFYHESWLNDNCSFRAMTDAVTVRFKLDKLLTFLFTEITPG